MALTARELEVIVGATVIAGALLWATWPAAPVPEVITAAPQVVQADHSMIVTRAPQAHPPLPPHQLPKGSVEVRRFSATVAPSAAAAASGCPPVHIDLSTVRIAGGQRVIASSPDGTISQALDVPIEAGLEPPPPKPWAAGLSYGTNRSVGLWVDRDIGGRLRIGAALQRLQDGRAEAQLRLGLRW